jgi:hypothetical protein
MENVIIVVTSPLLRPAAAPPKPHLRPSLLTQLMNMKAQELFLDMSRHTKTIRFKSIKNIYNTLTEGKADEVIYQKDKQQLIDQHVFNQK